MGDRALVRLDPDAPAGVSQALQIVAIKQTDVARKQQMEREDWQRRGVGGLVRSVDAASGTIVLTAGAGAAARAWMRTAAEARSRKKTTAVAKNSAGDRVSSRKDRKPAKAGEKTANPRTDSRRPRGIMTRRAARSEAANPAHAEGGPRRRPSVRRRRPIAATIRAARSRR